MEHTFDTLIIIAEITTAFVAFAAIVASIRVTLGKKLTAFQNLLVHFFIESGMLAVSIALMPLVLWGFWQNEVQVATYTMIYNLAAVGLYMFFYIRKRIRIKAPTPLTSLLVISGWFVWLLILILSLSGQFWQPSFAIIAAGCLWNLCGSVLIFATFLGTFFEDAPAKTVKGKK